MIEEQQEFDKDILLIEELRNKVIESIKKGNFALPELKMNLHLLEEAIKQLEFCESSIELLSSMLEYFGIRFIIMLENFRTEQHTIKNEGACQKFG